MLKFEVSWDPFLLSSKEIGLKFGCLPPARYFSHPPPFGRGAFSGWNSAHDPYLLLRPCPIFRLWPSKFWSRNRHSNSNSNSNSNNKPNQMAQKPMMRVEVGAD